MVKLSVAVPESTWRVLRDLAELQRDGGRPSVSRVVAGFITKGLGDVDASAVEPQTSRRKPK